MKSISLYNQDESLCSEAQFLLSFKSSNMSMTEWRKRMKEFKSLLSVEDLKEFERLKTYIRSAKWRAENPEKSKASNANWRAENPEKVKEDNTKWRKENPEKVKEDNTKWRKENPEKVKESNTRWYAENPEKSKASNAKRRVENPSYMNDYHKQRRAKDPLIRLQHNMRCACTRVVKQLSFGKKPLSTFKWVGCSPEELKVHLESLFLEGMSWENYGEWHIDHIRPVCSFSADECEQINHYSNLQPLWAEDNYAKGAKWDVDLSEKSIDDVRTVEGVESRAPRTTQDELLVTQEE